MLLRRTDGQGQHKGTLTEKWKTFLGAVFAFCLPDNLSEAYQDLMEAERALASASNGDLWTEWQTSPGHPSK